MLVQQRIHILFGIVKEPGGKIDFQHVARPFAFEERAPDAVPHHLPDDPPRMARIDAGKEFMPVAGLGVPSRSEQVQPACHDPAAFVFHPFPVNFIMLDPVEFRIPPRMNAQAELNAQILRQLHVFRISQGPLVGQRGDSESGLFCARGIRNVGNPLPHQMILSVLRGPFCACRAAAGPLRIQMLNRREKGSSWKAFQISAAGRQSGHRFSVPLIDGLFREKLHGTP